METRCLHCMKMNETGAPCAFCGFDPNTLQSDPDALPPGTRLGRYIIGLPVSRSACAINYHAYDALRDLHVAVREVFAVGLHARTEDGVTVLSSSELRQQQKRSDVADNAFSVLRFLQCFPDTPAKLRIYGSFDANGTSYMAFEHLNGTLLSEKRRQTGGKMPFDAAVRLMLPVLNLLQMVHEAGWVHGAISMRDIFCCDDGGVRLLFRNGVTDFRQPQDMRRILISQGFAAPECYSVKTPLLPSTDIYACCAVLWMLLSGRCLPDAPDRLQGKPLPPLGRNVPPEMEMILRTALELSPENRFRTAAEPALLLSDTLL